MQINLGCTDYESANDDQKHKIVKVELKDKIRS